MLPGGGNFVFFRPHPKRFAHRETSVSLAHWYDTLRRDGTVVCLWVSGKADRPTVTVRVASNSGWLVCCLSFWEDELGVLMLLFCLFVRVYQLSACCWSQAENSRQPVAVPRCVSAPGSGVSGSRTYPPSALAPGLVFQKQDSLVQFCLSIIRVVVTFCVEFCFVLCAAPLPGLGSSLDACISCGFSLFLFSFCLCWVFVVLAYRTHGRKVVGSCVTCEQCVRASHSLTLGAWTRAYRNELKLTRRTTDRLASPAERKEALAYVALAALLL